MPINTKYLKKYTFLRYNSFAKLNLYKIFFAVIYRLLRFGEKKECRRQRFSDFHGCPLQNFLQK